eukprot:403371590
MWELIGKGACGKVYKGLNLQNGQLVAIKQIRINNFKEHNKRSLQSEINLLKKLEHPNIVKYIDSIQTEQYLNIILEYVENGSLDKLAQKFEKLPETLVAIYVYQVLHGLDYLHRQAVIHRDIKGANILTTKDGIVKLADFGVATKINESEKSNSAVGTPYWMAPEVIEMNGLVTQACDIWSLGCTVIELMTGQAPYQNFQPVTAMIKIVQEGIPALPESFSEELKDFLSKCFEKDPDRRHNAQSLLQHAWMKKYDTKMFQNIINSNQELPELVSKTIRTHISQAGKPYNSMYQKVKDNRENQLDNLNQISIKQPIQQQHRQNLINSVSMQQECLVQKKPTQKAEDDEDGELGDFGEEINDMNDVPIERPKCLSNINFSSNPNDKNEQLQMMIKDQNMMQPPISKVRRLQTNRSIQNSRSGYINNNQAVNPIQQIQSIEQVQQEINFSDVSQQKQFQQINLKQPSLNSQASINHITNLTNQTSISSQNTVQTAVNQRAGSGSQRQMYKSQDKSAGPGSGNAMQHPKQSYSQTPQNIAQIDLQNQSQQNQVFDVQGNRKVYYLTKKSKQGQTQQYEISHAYAGSGGVSGTNNPNEISQMSLSLSQTSRQKRIEKQQRQGVINLHQHHMTAANANYQNNQVNQGNFNFQFQHDSQDYELQNPQFIGRQQSAQQPQTQQIIRNIQHQHNYTQMPVMPQNQMLYQYSDTEIAPNNDPRFMSDNMAGIQAHQKRKYTNQFDKQGNILQSKYNSGSNQSYINDPSMQNKMVMQEGFDELKSDNLDEVYIQKQESDFSGPNFPKQYMFGSSADFNMQNGQSLRKRTQLSEQKLGRGHLTQLYGNSNNNQMFHHIQHKSVISGFQGSSVSPSNMAGLSQQQFMQAAQRRNGTKQDGTNGSFENFLDTVSNYEDQYLFGTVGGTSIPTNMRASMINMQNLKNVRESYSKKFADQVRTNQEDQRVGMMMMYAMNPQMQNYSSEADSNTRSKTITQTQNINQLAKQNTNQSSIQMQSIGSGRSNNSVQIHQQVDTEAMEQLQEECKQLSKMIRKAYEEITSQQNDSFQEITEPNFVTQTEMTEENQETDINEQKLQKEQELKQLISQLSDFLKQITSQKQKAAIADSLGYHNMLGLLNLSDEIIYPTLLLINQFSEGSKKVQDNLCICGFLQKLIQLSNPLNKREIILDIGYFIGQIFQSQSTAFILFVSGGGCQILTDFLDFPYEESKDMIMLAIDAYYVLSNEKIDLLHLPTEDITIFLSKFQIVEKISSIIPKIYNDIETSEALIQQEQMLNYLEKAFDILQKIMDGPLEVVKRISMNQSLKNGLCKIVQNTINDPSHYTVMILKRFLRILQLATQHQQIFSSLEKQDVVRVLVEILQFFLNDIDHVQLQLPYDNLKLLNLLCKISTSRTEQASNASLMEHVFDLIEYLKSKQDSINTFVLWLQTDTSQIEQFLSKRETLDTIFMLYFQNPKSKIMLQVFSSINRMVQASPKIVDALAANSLIIEQLLNQVITCEKQIVSSARSINELGSLGSGQQLDENTQIAVNKNYYDQRIQFNFTYQSQQYEEVVMNRQIRQGLQMDPQSMQLVQNLQRINNDGVNSTRAKSPLFQ